MARFAAAEIEDQARRDLGAPERRFRIDPALEAVAGVGTQPQLPAGRRGAQRVEQGDFEEDIGRLGLAAGFLAAHQAADGVRRPVVCDHGDFGRQRVFVAVERLDRLAVARHAHGRVADELAGVEHMQRPAQIVGHQVGDIDQCRNRP